VPKVAQSAKTCPIWSPWSRVIKQVAQNVTISLGYFILTKNHIYLVSLVHDYEKEFIITKANFFGEKKTFLEEQFFFFFFFFFFGAKKETFFRLFILFLSLETIKQLLLNFLSFDLYNKIFYNSYQHCSIVT
jgi:hypothetical protein